MNSYSLSQKILPVLYCGLPTIQQPLSQTTMVVVWLSGNIVGRINEVTLRQAGLVLRWVTVRGYTVLVSNQATQVHSAWPSLRG